MQGKYPGPLRRSSLISRTEDTLDHPGQHKYIKFLGRGRRVTPKMEGGRWGENNSAQAIVLLMVFHVNSFNCKGRFSFVYLFVNSQIENFYTDILNILSNICLFLSFLFFLHLLCGVWDAFHRKKLRVNWFLICFPDWKKKKFIRQKDLFKTTSQI